MAGSKPTRIPNVWDRLRDQENAINNDKARNRRVFNPQTVAIPPNPEIPPAGKSGTDTGNALPTAGGTMIGAIAYFPKLISMTLKEIGKPGTPPDSLSSVLDISKGIGADSSRIILAGTDGAIGDSDLEFIQGGQYAGQYLNLQGVLGNTIEIKDDTSGDGSAGLNIRTQTGESLFLIDNANMELIFDSTQNQWTVIGGGSGATPQAIFAILSADQTTNLAAGNHIEFDTVAFETGGLVLSTGVGQADGIISGFQTGRIYQIQYGIRIEGSSNAAALVVRPRINDTSDSGTFASALTVSSNTNESFLPVGTDVFVPTADTDTIRLEMIIADSLVNIEADSTYITVQTTGGGAGSGGGSVTTLGKLLDVSILPDPPIANDILQFNTTSGLWENQAASAGGGLLVDLSNLQAGAVPVVDMSLNNFDLENVTEIRMNAGGTGLIDNVQHLDFFETNHNIQSFGDRLELQVDAADRFSFLNGSNEATVLNNAGVVTDKIEFKDTVGTTSPENYEINQIPNVMNFNVPTLKTFRWSVSNEQSFTMDNDTFRGDIFFAQKNLTILDTALNFPTDGTFGVSGADVIIGSGGNAVNLTDLFNSVGGQFEDTTFAIFDNGDNTKVAKFDAAAIATGNTRTYNFQDANGRIALLDGLQQNFTQNISMGGNTLQSVGGMFTDANDADIGQNTNYFDDFFINQIFFFGDPSLGYKIGGDVTDGFDFVVPDTQREFDFFFDGGVTPSWIIRASVIDAQGGRLEDLEEIQFDGNSVIPPSSAVRRIGFDGSVGQINMPTGGTFSLLFNGTSEWNVTNTTLSGDNIILNDTLTFNDSVGVPFTGQIVRNGADLFVDTTNGVKNFKDIGGGGAGSAGLQDAELNTVHDTSEFDFKIWTSHAKQGDKDLDQNSKLFATNPTDTIYFFPFYIGEAVTVDKIGQEVAQGGLNVNDISVAIYNTNTGQNYPTSRLSSSFNAFVNTDGVFGVSLGSGVALTPGLYWFALWWDGGATNSIRGFPLQCCNAAGWAEDANGGLTAVTAYTTPWTSNVLPTSAPNDMSVFDLNVVPACFALLS